MNIFISFSGAARTEFAIKFLDFFNKYGLHCWYDHHELLLGDELKTTIIKSGIDTADYCVLIINKTYLTRKWPCEEAVLLYNRFKEKKDCVIFPILLDISKDDLANSDLKFLLDIKYQFLQIDESIEKIGFQIMNRIFADIVKNIKIPCINEALNYFKRLTFTESIDIYNALVTLNNFNETDYKEKTIFLICLIRLFKCNPFEKTIREISYYIYNNLEISFDMYKVTEYIFLICSSEFVS